MAKTPLRQIARIVNTKDEDGIIQVDKIDVPHTQIVNRAQIIDLENDLSVNFGINRMMVTEVFKIINEQGPNGETIFGTPNDKFNQIRLVGRWKQFNDASGPRAQMIGADLTSYAEITFYGTGLNLLTTINTSTENYVVSIDGGAYSSNIVAGANSAIIDGRFYKDNQVLRIATGLALGIHTIRVKNNTLVEQLQVHGFETITESSNLEINAGYSYINQIRVKHTGSSIPYNSDFTSEYGVAGNKGGNVLVYLDDRGVVRKDVRYTDTRADLALADHSNEELVRKVHYTEFGAGRGDDFSSIINVTTDRAFTLDDGTTTLTGNNMRQQAPNINLGMVFDGVGAFIQFTFVGTGCDLRLRNVKSGTSTYQVFVDALQVTAGATIPSAIWGNPNEDDTVSCKIASGLPYGTHTVKMLCSVSATNVQFVGANVYQPKKPELPVNTIELADYNLMADFVADTNASINTVSTGTLRKANVREFIYVGTWSSSGISVTGRTAGYDIRTTVAGGYLEYYFYGTGFDMRLDSNGTTTFEVDGSSDLSSFATAHYGTGVWTPAAGTIVGNLTNSEHVVVEGLTLGLHKLRVTLTSGTGLYPDSLDIITPIHSRKNSGPYIFQDTIDIGSQAINDTRNIENSIANDKVVSYTTFGLADTSSNRPDNVVEYMWGWQNTIKTNGGPVEICGEFHFDSSGGAGNPQLLISIVIDGKVYASVAEWSGPVTGLNNAISFKRIINLEAGYHHIKYMWYESSNTDDIRIVGGGAHVYAREL